MTLWKPYSIYLIACRRKQEVDDTTTSTSYKSGVVPAPHKWYLAPKKRMESCLFQFFTLSLQVVDVFFIKPFEFVS